MRTHSLADARSLALHRVIAERLRQDPRIVERAELRVRDWARNRTAHPHYVALWASVLAMPPEDVAAAIVEDSERGRELRQMTPFAGVIDARERWRIWKSVGTSA